MNFQAEEKCYSFFAIETWGQFNDVKWCSAADFTKTSQPCRGVEPVL